MILNVHKNSMHMTINLFHNKMKNLLMYNVWLWSIFALFGSIKILGSLVDIAFWTFCDYFLLKLVRGQFNFFPLILKSQIIVSWDDASIFIVASSLIRSTVNLQFFLCWPINYQQSPFWQWSWSILQGVLRDLSKRHQELSTVPVEQVFLSFIIY